MPSRLVSVVRCSACGPLQAPDGQPVSETARAVLAWWSGAITREELYAELARVRAS